MRKLRKRKAPKRTLALPDLEHAKSAVVNSLSSASGQRTYAHAIDEFVGWYCSEPRLAFNRTVVLRYRIFLEQRAYAPATINLPSPRCVALRTRPPTRGSSAQSSRLAFGASRASGAWVCASGTG